MAELFRLVKCYHLPRWFIIIIHCLIWIWMIWIKIRYLKREMVKYHVVSIMWIMCWCFGTMEFHDFPGMSSSQLRICPSCFTGVGVLGECGLDKLMNELKYKQMAFKSEFQGYAPTIRDSSPLFHKFGSWIWIFLCYTLVTFHTLGTSQRNRTVRRNGISLWETNLGAVILMSFQDDQTGVVTPKGGSFGCDRWKQVKMVKRLNSICFCCYRMKMEYLHVLFFMEYLRFTMKMSWKNWKDAQTNCKGMFASESSSKVSAPSRAVQKRVMKHVQEFVLGTPQGFLNNILRLGTTPLRF